MRIYNSLSRQVQEFVPINKDNVGVYTCGPTVYDYASIGNFRTYTMSDILLRTLKYLGYKTTFIMNLTDVGHLSGDNAGDADTGEDRMEKAEKRENKNAWDIAQFYIDAFIKDFDKMNLIHPLQFTRATEFIPEQIELVKEIEAKGMAYKIKDGIYFDTVKFEEITGGKYGVMSDMDQIKEGARVEINPEKKNPRDFALWKFSEVPGQRHMEWDSPWGIGFPGWHIECSAMSRKFLGDTFDIHCGGQDLKQTHHVNEIAQSEAATGKKFVNYWVHGAFLKVDGGRMGKSLGNAYNITDIENRGFNPLALRYFYLTSHYRASLNFTWEGLTASQNALNKLYDLAKSFQVSRSMLSQEKDQKRIKYSEDFKAALSDDLNMPQALAVVWEAAKSNIPNEDKLDLLLSFDEVLGLKILENSQKEKEISQEIKDLIEKRDKARNDKDFPKSDELRKQIEEKGFIVLDTPQGTQIK